MTPVIAPALAGFMTNFRVQVQLKASAEIKVLKDGSASLSIKFAQKSRRQID
jgi:hypothetical protein